MSRIKDLQKQVHRVLERIEDSDKRAKAVAHLHGVALAAAILAGKRGEDAELASMAGLLHDLYCCSSSSCGGAGRSLDTLSKPMAATAVSTAVRMSDGEPIG